MKNIGTKYILLIIPALYVFSLLTTLATVATASFEPGKDVSLVWKKPISRYTRSDFSLVKINSDKMIFSHYYTKDDDTLTVLLRCFTTDNLQMIWEQSIPIALASEKAYGLYALPTDKAITYIAHSLSGDGNSINATGIQVDPQTGKLLVNKQLATFDRKAEKRTNVDFATSPDSSFAFFYRYDYSPYIENDQLEIKIEVVRINTDLSNTFFDTLSVPLIKEFDKLLDWGMDNDEVYLGKSLHHINIDDAGALYQVTNSSPNLVTVYQWPIGSKIPKTLSLPVEKVDVTNRNMTFYRATSGTVPKRPNIIHVAGGCLADSKSTTDRYFFGTFDFESMKLSRQWVYTPPASSLQELIDDDKMDYFRVNRIEVSPVDSSVLLICQKDLTTETYDIYTKASGQMRKTPTYTKHKTADFLIFSVDKDGSVSWTNAIRNEAEDRTLTRCIREDSVRRLIYYDNDNDGFVQRKINITNGEISPLKQIVEVDGSTGFYIKEFVWIDRSTIITLLAEGSDEDDMYFIKLMGL